MARVAAGACTVLVAALCSGWVLGTEHESGSWPRWASVDGVVSALRDGGDATASRGGSREPDGTRTRVAAPTGEPATTGDRFGAGSAPSGDPTAEPTEPPAAAPTEPTDTTPAATPDGQAAEEAEAAAAAAPTTTPAPAQPAARPAAPAPAPPAPAPAPPPADKASAYASDLAAGVNAERAKAGLPALAPQACAQTAAQQWAQHLASSGTFEHQDIGAVMSRCKLRGVGENIAMTGGSPAQMVSMWMNSPGHKQNILRPGYTGLGSAAVQNSRGQWVGVHVFTS